MFTSACFHGNEHRNWQSPKKKIRRKYFRSVFLPGCLWRDNSILIQMTKISEDVKRNYLQKQKEEYFWQRRISQPRSYFFQTGHLDMAFSIEVASSKK